MPKIMIPAKQLLEHEVEYGGSDEVEVYEDTITGKGRWSIYHRVIFKWLDGKVYSAEYSRGATEMQYEDPWEEDPWEHDDEVECTEVQQVEKIVKVWEAV